MNYILKTMHSIYSALDEEERQQIHIIVNNVDIDPDSFHEAQLLSKYFLFFLFSYISFIVSIINLTKKKKKKDM